MPSSHRSALLLLAIPCLAEDTPKISVTLRARAAIYKSLGEAVLEIQIKNTSGQPLTVQTTDADPPIALMALYQNGEPAIIVSPIGKNRKARTFDYGLDPGEIRNYESTISKLLNEGQSLSETRAGVVNLTGSFVIVRYEGGVYKADPIQSNTVKIEVVPSAKKPADAEVRERIAQIEHQMLLRSEGRTGEGVRMTWRPTATEEEIRVVREFGESGVKVLSELLPAQNDRECLATMRLFAGLGLSDTLKPLMAAVETTVVQPGCRAIAILLLRDAPVDVLRPVLEKAVSDPALEVRRVAQAQQPKDPLGVPVHKFSATGTFEEVLRELAIQLRSNVVFGFLKQEGPNPNVTVTLEQATAGEVLSKMCDQDTRYKIAVTKSPHVINIVPTNDNARGMNLLRLRVARFDLVTDDWPPNLFMRLPEFSAEIHAYLAAWYTRESRQTEPLGSPGASMSTNVHPPHVVLHFEDSTVIEILNALSEWVFERASVPDPTLPQGVKIWQLGWKCEVPPVGRSSLDFWSHSIFSGSPN